MTKQEIINYIMTQPENTNPLVLRDLLTSYANEHGAPATDSDFFIIHGYVEEGNGSKGGGSTPAFLVRETYEEIAAAIDEDKLIILEYDGKWYIYLGANLDAVVDDQTS